jgi:hypothetical protein
VERSDGCHEAFFFLGELGSFRKTASVDGWRGTKTRCSRVFWLKMETAMIERIKWKKILELKRKILFKEKKKCEHKLAA